MRIWLNPDKMAALGVTPSTCATRSPPTTSRHGCRPGEGRLRADDDQRRDLARQRRRVRQAGRVDARRRADPPRRHLRPSSSAPENADSSSVFDGLKAVFIGIYATPTANPLTVIGDVRKTFPDIQRQLPAGMTRPSPTMPPSSSMPPSEEVEKTLIEAAADRHRRHLPVPRQPALDAHPDRHHPAVAHRRDVRAARARLFDQPA